MKQLLTASTLAAALFGAGGASAAGDTATVGPMPVTGNVPAMCSSGGVNGGDTIFALGVIVDTATGFLLPNLTAPPKTLTASFCNSRSTISVTATPMVAQSFAGPAPDGFSKSVNYVATASGWTSTAASYSTGEATHPAATQSRSTAFTGDITVGVTTFTTVGGPALRMVADPLYQGTVTVTLAVALTVRTRDILIGGLASLASAGGATAAAGPQVMTVAGNAPQICAVQNPVVGQGALINFRSLNGTTLQIDQLADPKTLATSAALADIRFAAVCNYPHRITLESDNNGLWRGGSAGSAPPQGFADGVPYTATLTWGQVTDRFEADATSRRINQDVIPVDVATAGDIQIRLTIQAGASNLRANAPLIAGVYTDTLRVTVEPQ